MTPKPTKPTAKDFTARATVANMLARHTETGSTIPFGEWYIALVSAGLVHVRTGQIEVVTRPESVGDVLGL